jgi:hypothetical protein
MQRRADRHPVVRRHAGLWHGDPPGPGPWRLTAASAVVVSRQRRTRDTPAALSRRHHARHGLLGPPGLAQASAPAPVATMKHSRELGTVQYHRVQRNQRVMQVILELE